jgi:hypothetical protein
MYYTAPISLEYDPNLRGFVKRPYGGAPQHAPASQTYYAPAWYRSTVIERYYTLAYCLGTVRMYPERGIFRTQDNSFVR